jgi:hypothetical protein
METLSFSVEHGFAKTFDTFFHPDQRLKRGALVETIRAKREIY